MKKLYICNWKANKECSKDICQTQCKHTFNEKYAREVYVKRLFKPVGDEILEEITLLEYIFTPLIDITAKIFTKFNRLNDKYKNNIVRAILILAVSPALYSLLSRLFR